MMKAEISRMKNKSTVERFDMAKNCSFKKINKFDKSLSETDRGIKKNSRKLRFLNNLDAVKINKNNNKVS